LRDGFEGERRGDAGSAVAIVEHLGKQHSVGTLLAINQMRLEGGALDLREGVI
jgi:hypothetical protein